MAELQVGQEFTPNLRGSSGQGVVQVSRSVARLMGLLYL